MKLLHLLKIASKLVELNVFTKTLLNKILFCFRVLRNNRTKIHINLFTAILIQVILRLIIYVDELTEKNETNGINVGSSFAVRSLRNEKSFGRSEFKLILLIFSKVFVNSYT